MVLSPGYGEFPILPLLHFGIPLEDLIPFCPKPAVLPLFPIIGLGAAYGFLIFKF
jgi:hypothetical protein